MKSLKEKLIEYTKSGIYPMHMPGHKRNAGSFSDVENIDFTEVEGLDNLHDPEGILKESMDDVSKLLGTDKTYFSLWIMALAISPTATPICAFTAGQEIRLSSIIS